MFKNYLKTALRNLWKNKGFSLINILGLAIGLATCLLIIIYVMDELSYDRFNEKADRTYRLDGDIKFGGNHFILAVAPAPAGPAMRKDYPEIETAVRFRWNGGFLVKKGSQNIREDRVVFADSTLFDVFSFPLIAGDPHTALVNPHTIVISETIAKKYFNSTDVLGKILVMNDSINYKVTGVMRDIPSQSHFHSDFFVPMTELEDSRSNDNWLSNNYNTYIVLRKGADPHRLEAKFPGMIQKYISPLLQQAVHISLEDFFKAGNFVGFSLMPLTDIHLHSNKTAEMGPNGSIQYVYIFSAIAIFILLIACVNFMNLSTARSSNRAKEVGIRKVLGSLRGHLIAQFIAESVLISFISLLLALGIAWLMLPVFNDLAAKQMSIGLFSRTWLAPCLLALVLVVGLLAGSYPAFFLSSFRPIEVLKGKVAAGFKTGWLRNSLVVFQFGISIFLMVGTAVIYRQLGYIRSRPLGFDREQVLIVHNGWGLGQSGARAFRDGLLKLPGVEGTTMTGFMPTGDNRNDDAFFLTPELDQKKAISMQRWSVDENYVPVLGMKMMAGRNFSKDFKTDSDAVVINEAAARMMSFSDPMEHKVYELEDLKTKKVKAYRIIGVLKDFNFNSLREVVTPLALFLQEDRGSFAMRVHTTHMSQLVQEVENGWKKIAPGQPFSYSFMDEDFNTLYKSEQRMGGISLSFSLLAIFIACLGLFGLAAYAAEQRTREIGIRKVLGATVGGIMRLLSRDFLRLVLLSALIAFPFAWWAMHRWLQDFAYRISIGWEVFALAAVLSVGIALLTVSFQALRAALANPVKSLRSE
ncbi:MAG TPA: ABC transporter permease [Puia sp.]|jgi:putative ABC transport system permease protein